MDGAGAPRTIGPYTVVETVATRAFTITYRASQPGLDRTVLVKARKATVSAASPFAAEIEREAAVLARLDHEAIVRLFDFTRSGDAARLVIEDARGPSLAEVIAAGRVDPDAAAAIALAVARGIGHAHERHVVHRALSPAAIVVTRAGGVKIGDFSTAAILAAASAPEEPPLPEPVEPVDAFARPDYLAPEQILGDAARPASDVWSIGAILHEMLAGARPFEGADRRALAQRIRTGSPAALPGSVPRALEQVVARCLARAPEDRYDDARALAAAIEAAMAPRTRVPVPILISRALSAAKLGDELRAPAAAGSAAPASWGPDVAAAARSLGVVLALLVAGGAAIQGLLRDPDASPEPAIDGSSAAAPAIRGRGLLRVVATPWAEVYLDGELVDVTPVGRAIPVSPGKHFVTFRHPRAPDEQRAIKIAPGQTVLLDVTMRVARDADAGAKAPPDAGESP
jgi:eukaryotic-like serine/threonine-protein kinase